MVFMPKCKNESDEALMHVDVVTAVRILRGFTWTRIARVGSVTGNGKR